MRKKTTENKPELVLVELDEVEAFWIFSVAKRGWVTPV